MKTLNLVKTALVILVLSILVGCSDQITSSGEANTSPKEKQESVGVTEDGLPVKNVFRTQIRIKPYRSYKFDASNTPFVKFTALEIERIADPNIDKYIADCQDLAVYSTLKDKKYVLSCHEKGLNTSEITIENTSSEFVELNVTLDGVRAKKYIAVDTE